MEKIFADDISDKGLVSNIYKESPNSTPEKQSSEEIGIRHA